MMNMRVVSELLQYLGLGFLEWGREPDAMRHAEESITEVYVRLELSK